MTKQPHTSQTDHPQTPSPNVRLSPPPPALMRLLNPLVRRVLSSRHLGGRIDQMMLLEFTGRRSGRRIRVPVALHLIDGVPMAFTHRPWRLNFTGGAPVTVTHRGQVRQGRRWTAEHPRSSSASRSRGPTNRPPRTWRPWVTP
jgi:hypothetical protein